MTKPGLRRGGAEAPAPKPKDKPKRDPGIDPLYARGVTAAHKGSRQMQIEFFVGNGGNGVPAKCSEINTSYEIYLYEYIYSVANVYKYIYIYIYI